MSEPFADHCILGMSGLAHVAQQTLREKLRLVPPNPTDLVPLQDTDLPPSTNALTLFDPSLYSNPNLLLEYPANPHGGLTPQQDWLMNYTSRYQDLQALQFSNPYSIDMATQLLPHPYPANDPLVPSYTADKLGNPNELGRGSLDMSTQGLTLSLASSSPLQEPHGLLPDQFIPTAIAVGKNVGGHCTIGPLGPFTGYAAILQNSKFLNPAIQLLDECCTAVTGITHPRPSDLLALGRRVAAEGAGIDVKGLDASASSSSRRNYDGGGESGGLHHAEIQERKAKLLVLQGEVCRRYKQYNQQIQMAISSFESVAGLSGAIPYMSAAVKTVSRHFRFLKNVISEQVMQISRALGEEIASSPSMGNCERASTSRSRFMDQTLRRQKAEQSGLGVVENHQPIWRPQRGLPERAVAVLRAWLFDHFLHPYPTDTDKLMLAQQTGLTRNQVSNWFINARVRVWKPMVEEIHMLETKSSADRDLNSSKTDCSQPAIANQDLEVQQNQQTGRYSHLSEVEPLPFNPSHCQDVDQWQMEKRSRIEPCSSGANVADAYVDLSTYQGGFDMGGLGSVSLTLALRQEEGAWQQPYQQMRPYFGSQMINE